MVWEDGLQDELIGQHKLVLLVIRKRSAKEYRCAGLVLAPSTDSSGGSFQRTGVADFEISGELFDRVRMVPHFDIALV